MTKVPISTTLPDDVFRLLKMYAAQQELKINEIVTRAIIWYLNYILQTEESGDGDE